MKKNDKVIHKNYGEATVTQIVPKHKNFKKGILLTLNTEEGIKKINEDRLLISTGKETILERCFEDDLSLITKKV